MCIPRVYHVQEPSFQQRVQLDPIDRAKQPHGAIPPCRRQNPAMYWCNSNALASAALETRVSSYLSVAGKATPSKGGHKDPKRVVPTTGGWEHDEDDDGGVRRWGPESAGCQNCRLNMTRAPQVKLRDCNSPFPPRATIPLLLFLLFILFPRLARLIEIPIQSVRLWNSFDNIGYGIPRYSRSPLRNHPPVTPRPVDQCAVELMWCRPYILPRSLLPRP